MIFQYNKHTFLTGLTASIFINLASPSIALEEARFAKRITEIFSEEITLPVEHGDVHSNNDQVIIHNVKIIAPRKTLPLGTITFNGVQETGNNGYTIEAINFEDIDIKEKNFNFNLKDIEINGLKILDKDAQSPASVLLFYDRFSTGPFVFNKDGTDTLKFSGIEANIVTDKDYQNVNFNASLNDIQIDFSSIPDPQVSQTLSALGYDTINGDMKFKGHWNLDKGHIELSQSTITFDNLGRLNTTLSISGYTLDFIKKIQPKQEDNFNNAKTGKAQRTIDADILNMMRELTFQSASIRYDDASFTNRILKFAGARHGLSGEQMAQQVKKTLPLLLLAGLPLPKVQEQAIDAASTYLDSPQNIEIKATAHELVSFGELADAALVNPQNILDFIDIKITANQ